MKAETTIWRGTEGRDSSKIIFEVEEMQKVIMSNQQHQTKEPGKVTGIVFNIQRFSIHDGPGIRTTVFFKGCPLRCHWCANPESINPFPELGFIRTYCTKCPKCMEICPVGAVTIGEDGYPIIDRNICDNCGLCTEVCYPEALKVYGQEMTASRVLEEVMKDSPFYRESGGGVTLSGGEPLQQPTFSISLLKLCQTSGIHTAIETCGFSSPKVFKAALEYADYLLFDVKDIDAEIHRRYTGQSNKLILENLNLAAGSGVHFLVRMPLIPGINDTKDNIQAMAELVKGLGGKMEGIELMPYHRLGSNKCEALERIYPMGDLPAADMNHVEQVRTLFGTLGIHCSISK